MKKFFCSIIICFLLFSQTAFAHHAWIEKEGDRFLVAWGHPPKLDPYDPQRVKEIKGFNIKGEEILLKRTEAQDKIYLSSADGVSMITLSFEGGFLVTTPEGKKRLTKREAQKEGLQIADSIYSMQSAKSIFAFGNAVTKPAGLKLEIIPLKNPLIKTGEFLPIRVLFEGKPLEGAIIEIGAHKEVAKTDKNGEAKVPTDGKGMQIILAKHRIAAKDNPDADYFSYTSALTFEIK